MKFIVNSVEFERALRPVINIATKNTKKEFKYEFIFTLESFNDKITCVSYGGKASITSTISNDNFASLNYSCEKEGNVTIDAEKMFLSLKSIPNVDVEIEVSSGQLNISTLSGKKYVRSIAVYDEPVVAPNVATKFSKEIEINREIFINGMNRILFSPEFEEKMLNYMCMLFESFHGDEDIVRFSAGSGGRFAVKEIMGKNIIKNKQDVRMILPKDNLANIVKVLTDANCEKIKVKYAEADSSELIPEQIVFNFGETSCDEINMCIFGIDRFSKYPDLNKIIDYQYPNRIFSDLKDWDYAISGIDMTLKNYKENIHNTKVVLKTDKNIFMVNPLTKDVAESPVDIVDDEKCIISGDDEDIWFTCNSIYLKEMVVHAGKMGKIQLNFESQSILENIPDDQPQQMKPILVKFDEKIDDAKSITENFYMFFTVSTK